MFNKTLVNNFALIFLSKEKSNRIKMHRGTTTPTKFISHHDVPGDSNGQLKVLGWGLMSAIPHVTQNTPHLLSLYYTTNQYCMARHIHVVKWP